MKNDTETTTWTLGELCDYWRANLARLQASMDFRTLAAIQEVFSKHQSFLKISAADNLYMPISASAEQAPVAVPSWIPKPEGKRGLPARFRRIADIHRSIGGSINTEIAEEFNAIAAEYDSTTNPFEKKLMGIQAASFPGFDMFRMLTLLSKFGPLLARIDQIKAMPQGKERIAATARLVADISAAVAEMLGTGSTVKGPFGAARKKAGKR